MRYDYLYMDPWSADKREGNRDRKPLYVCLSGNSGLGKSTLLKRLSSSLFLHEPRTIAIDEKGVHHPLLAYLFDDTHNYGYLIQLNFMIQRALMVKSWLDKGYNLVMERSHLEDYIFINFMLKEGYVSESQHAAYMVLWNEINNILPTPDVIVFLNYPVAHSLQHLLDDENRGIRPQEFADEATKIKWITGWYREYQHFLDNLPENLQERVLMSEYPDKIDAFSDTVLHKLSVLRR